MKINLQMYSFMDGVHNDSKENLEAAACQDKRIIDVLIEETNPDYVSFELDAGWCAAAGYDPIEFLYTYKERIILVHIKESSKVIGPQPPMDFGAIPKDEQGRILWSVNIPARKIELRCLGKI